MKKMLSFALALVMLLAMFATVGATEGPAPEEAAPSDVPQATEQAAEPSAEPETVQPGDQEPAQQSEAPVEPAEPSAEPTAAPEAVEPTAEPVVSEPSDEVPADSVAAPASLPQVIDAPETTPEIRTVKVHAGDGVFPGQRAGYQELTVTLQEGKLPDTSALAEEKDWYEPARTGYRFAGWSTENTGGAVTQSMLHEKDAVPEEKAELWPCWVRVVVLDAAPGSFNDSTEGDGAVTQNYSRTVDIPDNNLPGDAPAPVYNYNKPLEEQTVEFIGWYTQKCTMTEAPSADGKYWTITVTTHGDKIEPGKPVPAGVTTLYAGYQVKQEVPEVQTQRVTYYLDWNGVDGMWGECLTSTRAYDAEKGGYVLQPGDLAVRYLNWDGEDPSQWGDKYEFSDMETLEAYWAERRFNGYKFLGWATTPEADKGNVRAGDVVTNGQSLYAVWEKDGQTSAQFAQTGRVEESAGPLTHMRFKNLNVTVHGAKEATAAAELYVTPKGAAMTDVVWTITYSIPRSNPLAPPESVTVEVTEAAPFTGATADKPVGFDAVASGCTLTFTNNDGLDHAITVRAKALPADEEGSPISDTYIETPEPAPATVWFTHSWAKDEDGDHLDPKCDASGYDTYECTSCGTTMQKIIPPLEHTWAFQITTPATCTKTGIMQDQCTVCGMTFEEYQQWLGNKWLRPEHETKILAATGHDYMNLSTKGIQGDFRILEEQCKTCHEIDDVIQGDLNNDGVITNQDVFLAYDYVTMKNTRPFEDIQGDVNGDGVITNQDIFKMYDYICLKCDSLA